MALITEVTNRFSNDLLVKLTNVDDATLTTVNTTFLGRVCDDVELGEFETHMNEAFDLTNRKHIIFACLLVKLKCIEYGASADETAEKLRTRVEKLGKAMREIGARDRISPQTSSPYTPSEPSGPDPIRPDFDDQFFERFTPEAPGAISDINDP